MLSRTTTPLVVSYILLIGAGILFLQAPPTSLEDATYGSLLTIWSTFFVVGPLVALTATTMRAVQKTKHLVALWHFEMAGLYLIVAADLVYSYALLRTGIYLNEYNLIAFSLVISAFASSFIGRIIDAWKLVKAVNKVSLDGKGAQ